MLFPSFGIGFGFREFFHDDDLYFRFLKNLFFLLSLLGELV